MRILVEVQPTQIPPKGDEQTLILQVGRNLLAGLSDFEEHFGIGSSTSLESDLLILAAAVFAADVAVKRGMCEDIVRDIELTIPVVNVQALEQTRSNLEEILHILSHDNWMLHYEQIAGQPEGLRVWPAVGGTALLFSGGLDSFAAAVDLLDEHGPERVLLTSHTTGNTTTIASQRRLHEYLEEFYTNSIRRVAMRTGGKKTPELEFAVAGTEVTQRTRSFMFLTIAALAARRTGISEIVMIAENGQMAIHLPLSAGRIGAFSTHTAHPSFVAKVSQFFCTVLRHPVVIYNPFLYQTKAEVVCNVANYHRSAVPLAVSCWKSSRVSTGHCGECIPCYVRRIALEYNGVVAGGWARDVFATDVSRLPPTNEGKRNLAELAAFAIAFRDLSDAELDMEYCELYNEHFDRNKAAAMYRRFAAEALEVMSRYPGLSSLL